MLASLPNSRVIIAVGLLTGCWMASCASVVQNRSGREAEVRRTAAEVKARLDAADKAFAQEDFADAEKNYQAAVAMAERIPRGDVPVSGNPWLTLSHLALGLFYLDQDRYQQAISLLQTSLPNLGFFFGSKHGLVGTNLVGQAVVYLVRGNNSEAESLLVRATPILRAGGAQHGTTRIIANIGLAVVFFGKLESKKAESLLGPPLAVLERADEPRHHRVSARLLSIVTTFVRKMEPEQAEPLMKRILAVIEKVRGPDDVWFAESIDNYAALLRLTNRLEEAELLESRARAIRERQVEPS